MSDRLGEQPARIAAQVEHDALRALVHEPAHPVRDAVHGADAEGQHAHVGERAPLRTTICERTAGSAMAERSTVKRSSSSRGRRTISCHRRPLLAREELERAPERQALHGVAVDRHDPVARLDPRLAFAGPASASLTIRPCLAAADGQPDAGVAARRAALEILVLVGGQVVRVRIVEPLDDRVDRRARSSVAGEIACSSPPISSWRTWSMRSVGRVAGRQAQGLGDRGCRLRPGQREA